MVNWSSNAGGIAILGILVLIFGYGWHDVTYGYKGGFEASECNAVFAAPWEYSSKNIGTCKDFEMSNYVVIIGWAMLIGGIIGYIALPKGSSPKPESKPKEPKEPKAVTPAPAKAAEKVILLCPKCGQKNDEDSEFCKKCGKRLRPKK